MVSRLHYKPGRITENKPSLLEEILQILFSVAQTLKLVQTSGFMYCDCRTKPIIIKTVDKKTKVRVFLPNLTLND